MAMLETNGREITQERLTDAQEKLRNLQGWLVEVDKALERAIQENDGNAFPIFWASEAITKLLGVYNEIARCNGAALVRAQQPE